MRALWLVLIPCLLAICPAATAQILSNSGFESGSTGWTTAAGSGTVTFTYPTGSSGLTNPVHAGSNAFQADVTNAGTSGYPSLTHTAFTASSGSTYYLRFFAWSGAPNSVNRPNMKLHIASSSGNYDVRFTPSSAGYDEYHFAFKASGSTTVSFTFEQAATFNLDDVEVHDQTDTNFDVLTQYMWQWGFQNYQVNTSPTPTNCFIGGDNDISTQLPDGRVAWLFNDSFVQTIDFTTDVRGGWSFPRNYVAIQSAPNPTQGTSTLVPLSTDTTAVFKPTGSEPNPNGLTISNPIYWPNDATVDGSNLEVLLDEPNSGGSGALIGKATATLSLPGLAITGYDYRTFGNFVLNAGDGYFYIYDSDGNGGMNVARAAAGSLNSFSSWTYWNGSSWVASRSAAVTVPNLDGGVRNFERLGPNNFAAVTGGGPFAGIQAQFATSPTGPWSNKTTIASTFAQKGTTYYYMNCLHRELAQNGLYSIGYSDGFNDENDGSTMYGSNHPLKSKGIYNPHYVKTSNLLDLSPYTLNELSDDFSSASHLVWWQPYGGIWTISGGTYNIGSGFVGYYSVAKGVIVSDGTVEADVTCSPNGSSGYAGLIFRGSNFAVGSDNYTGYGVVIKPGFGAILIRANGGGSSANLGTASMTITSGTSYHVKVVAEGSSIKAYIGGSGTPQISVTDATYASGGVGVRTYFANTAKWDNFAVTPDTITNEVENLSVAASSGDANTVYTEAGASGGKAVKYLSNAAGDYVVYAVPVSRAGTYRIDAIFKEGTDRGIMGLSIGNTATGQFTSYGDPIDLYAASLQYVEMAPIDTVTFATAGTYYFKFAVTGKNGASSNYNLYFDAISLVQK